MQGMMIQTNPAVRLLTPSYLTSDKWVAEDFLTRRRFSIPPAGILLLVGSVEPIDYQMIIGRVADRLDIAPSPVQSLGDSLVSKRLLLDPSNIDTDEDLRWFKEICRRWSSYGWTEAVEYHMASFDYEFVGAGQEGRDESRRRMAQYSRLEPDNDRFKNYSSPKARISLPVPDETLVPNAASLSWTNGTEPHELTQDNLMALVSICFGIVGRRRVSYSQHPILLRSSPSGGARHPTEAYLLIIDVPGLRSGVYHVNVEHSELELQSAMSFDPIEMRALFPTTFGRATFPLKAVLVLTSLFERNMYRYREPRTFRTVHMDAGHISGTVQLVAKSLGVKAFVQYGANEPAVERMLGIDGLDEGYMMSIGLGRGQSNS